MIRGIVALSLFAGASASCPNLCSSHGTCSLGDVCTCSKDWMGPDCSLRVCPSGSSWALDSSTPHGYEECSGAGLCDRVSGACKCFSGFEGYSCQRRSCPNDCSGNGLCRMLQDVPTTIPYGSDAWDSTQLMACVCDVGFFGSDCSQRRCATGDDPITTCPDTAFGGQVQEIKVTLGSELMHSLTSISGGSSEGMELFGVDSTKSFDVVREDESEAQVILGATDAYGQVYYAPTSAKAVFSKDSLARGGVDPGATSVEIALENIRNYRVDDVSVSAVQTGVHGADCSTATTATASCPYGKKSISILEKRYLVTFVPNELNSANFGKQNALVCKSGYSCPVSGCSPMVKMPFLYRYASSSSTTTGMDFSAVSGTTFSFYAGAALNSDTNFNAKSFIRLSDLSSPQLPMGMSPDSGVSASSASRYDIRVVVAVEDPEDANNGDSPVDVYWTKVVYGHVNIATDTNEYSGTTASGVWSASTGTYFTPTLLGFTYRGLIPTTLTASVPGAPGVELRFPDTNMVVDNKKYRFFEILVKLPSCSVTPLLTGAEFLGVNGQSLAPVDSRIENVECSNRGQCNRVSGLCECFSGFYGLSCARMTTMV